VYAGKYGCRFRWTPDPPRLWSRHWRRGSIHATLWGPPSEEFQVFEIGSSLREARLRRKLELSDVEHDTHIRLKYLMALEDDRFEALPGAAYAKGFLRTYADYLGLEGSRFVDEYNARAAPEEEPAPVAPARIQRGRQMRAPWLLTVPVAAAVTLVAWQLASSGGHSRGELRPSPATTRAEPPPPPPRPSARRTLPHSRLARILVVASRGPCWLAVRKESATGPQVFERTLQTGESARFVGKRLWIRFGAPWNTDARLNGKPVRLPTKTANVVVTSTGMNAVG
jgi:cytoskeleton protein RodZ